MDKLDQLIAHLQEISSTLANLDATENLSDDQKAEQARLLEDRTKTLAAIKTAEAAADREAEANAAIASAQETRRRADDARRRAAAPQPRRTDPDTPRPANLTPGAATGPEPAQPERIPATVRRYGRVRNFAYRAGEASPDERAYRFGQWGLAMLSRMCPSKCSAPSAIQWCEKNIQQFATATEIDGVGTQYLIPIEFSNDIIVLREKFGVARGLLKIEPMTSDTKTIPRRVGGLTANFVGQGGAGTPSTKQWDQVRLTAKDIMVLSLYSSQVSADAVINFGDDLAGEISYAYTLKEDQCAFLGDGSQTYGGIVGCINKLTNVDGLGNPSVGLVTAGVHGSWANLVSKDFSNLIAVLPEYADDDDATFVCHRTFYFSVMQPIELAAGGVTAREVQMGGGEGLGPQQRRGRFMFMGYPVTFSQVMPSTTAADQVPILFGNFYLGGTIGDRQQDSIAFSDQATVQGVSTFETNQIAIRGVERVDVNIHDAGGATTGNGGTGLAGPIGGLNTSH
jgi:HK97 family phage major capsid protein